MHITSRLLRAAALEAARKGGDVLIKNLAKAKRIYFKGEIDLVTNVDRAAEAAIVRTLKRWFPDHSFLTEEGGEEKTPSPYQWIIDPLDGTTNYAHAYPHFCVSIAVEVRGAVRLGVVNDPVRREIFIAEKGKGACLNGKRIKVSRVPRLKESLLATGFSYDVRVHPENNLDHWRNFIFTSQAVRRDGSAALNQCYVACGRLDGFWELRLHAWDTAAGSLIVTEAGGTVTDFSGKRFDIKGQETLASNGLIHKEMLSVLKGEHPSLRASG